MIEQKNGSMIPDLDHIYTGDCIEVMKTWPENFVDTIITDPPYGIRFMGKAWDGADIEKTIESKRRHTPRTDSHGRYSIENRAWAAGEYDRSLTANQAFQVWCADWAAAALRIVKPGGLMLVFGGTRTYHRMTAGLEDAGWQIRDCKSSRAERNEGCEGMEEKALNWSSGTKNPGSFQSEGTKKVAGNNHPTVKPLELMKYLCILTKTPTGGIVLDPFCGSGTTLWAAEFHNRPWIGIEMNSEYVAIAEKRISSERAQLKFV